MRFSVVAITSVPDIATTRRLFEVTDLDDESVAKVLFHHRRKQTGSSEVLRWDQRAIASITMIQHAADEVRIESLTQGEHDEPAMLHGFFRSTHRNPQLVTWGGRCEAIPLIHFRSLLHEISYPTYWQAQREHNDLHRDLREWLTPEAADSPELDETARRLGFPGLLDRTEDEAAAACLLSNYAPAQAYSELSAVNIYLIVLRLLGVLGELHGRDAIRARERLCEALNAQDVAHRTSFLAAWNES